MQDMRFSDLWRLEGTLGRVPYVVIGVTAFALKYGIDSLVLNAMFGRNWAVKYYWISPFGPLMGIPTFGPDGRGAMIMITALLAVALPFIWLGVVLTVRRLRTIGWPAWMVVVFFFPFLNLLFFLLLSTLPASSEVPPARKRLTGLEALIPGFASGAAIIVALLANLIVFPFVLFGTYFLEQYGWGLFVGIPFSLGLISVLLDALKDNRSLNRCFLMSTWSVFAGSFGLFATGLEGMICIFTTLPLGIPLAWMGAVVGYFISNRLPKTTVASHVLPLIVLVMPLYLWFEKYHLPEAPSNSVSSAVLVDAPPSAVWKRVISFDELPEPVDWVFRMGIAYPIRAEIDGTGVGAVRHCVFSTGVFVEPIEVWDEPRLLKFSVTSTPDPLEELTFYEDLRPPHLDGFFVAEGGQFFLESDSEGGTRLIGTTWYRQELWPAFYWRWVSDALIHRIHLRVLHHIKKLAEADITSDDTDLTGE